MSAALERSSLSMPYIPYGCSGVPLLAPGVVLVVIMILVILGSPLNDVTVLLNAASILIAQIGSDLRRNP